MMEGPDSAPRTGRAILIKKGQIIPENAVAMSDNDIIQIQETRISKFKPESEMRVFTWGQGTIGATVAITSSIINNMFRQNFRLGGLRKAATYLPAVIVPTVASLVLHDIAVKKRILVGKEECPLCIQLRSGAYQLGSGLVYPFIISFLGCLPIARENYTLPLPFHNSGSKVGSYLRLLRHVSPSSAWLLGLGAVQMFVGMKMANTELKVWSKYLSKPPSSSDIPLAMRYTK